MKIPVEVSTLNSLLDAAMELYRQFHEGKETTEFDELKDQLKQANSKWVVIKVDETHHWTIAPEGTKVYGIFLVDLNEVTYLCEMRPSHYCYHLYNLAEPANEEIETADIFDDQDIYLHTDKIPKDHHVVSEVLETDIEDSYEEMVEAYLEHYQGNHVF